MAVPKSRALLLSGCFILALFLQSCGGKPLSEREIVRGIFFEQQGDSYSVCLLLAGKSAEDEQSNYATASARGKTAAAALARVENSLQGSVYYGLADLAALPTATTYVQAQQLGNLLYEKIQPAPELSLFLLNPDKSLDWSKDAPALYEGMKACEKKQKIHCGLQQLFVQKNCCALPVYTPDGYAIAVLEQTQGRTAFAEGLSANVAALLVGIGKELNGTFAGNSATCMARADVTTTGATIRLHLRNVSMHDLTASREEEVLRRLLCIELQTCFSALTKQPPGFGSDPFHFAFRQKCLYGADAQFNTPTLEILFE